MKILTSKGRKKLSPVRHSKKIHHIKREIGPELS